MKSAFQLSMIICLFVLLFSCKSNTGNKATQAKDAVSKGQPQIKFDVDMHDFGEVIEGEKVSFTYKFTNTGTGPLLITGINSSCGCTVGEYTHNTIQPKGKGDVTVSFDSWKRVGFQQKSVTVNSNTQPAFQILRFKAMVIPENLNVK